MLTESNQSQTSHKIPNQWLGFTATCSYKNSVPKIYLKEKQPPTAQSNNNNKSRKPEARQEKRTEATTRYNRRAQARQTLPHLILTLPSHLLNATPKPQSLDQDDERSLKSYSRSTRPPSHTTGRDGSPTPHTRSDADDRPHTSSLEKHETQNALLTNWAKGQACRPSLPLA